LSRCLRVLLDVAAVASLLLAVGVGVLWVRGRDSCEVIRHVRWWEEGGRGVLRWYAVESSAGGVAIYRASLTPVAPRPDGRLVSEGWRVNRVVGLKEYPVLHLPYKGVHDDPAAGLRGYNGRWRGFQFARSVASSVGGYTREERTHLTMPCWAWLVAFTALPAARAVAFARRRRRERSARAGLCPACGYDLRATPARCPECGRQPAKT
jgi:hypothetical protein